MSEPRTVVVLGGGVGGLVAATTLRKKLGKEHRIVLVDREDNHVFAPSLLWLMTGARKREQIVRPLDRLGKKHIEVVRGEIETDRSPGPSRGGRRARAGRRLPGRLARGRAGA